MHPESGDKSIVSQLAAARKQKNLLKEGVRTTHRGRRPKYRLSFTVRLNETWIKYNSGCCHLREIVFGWCVAISRLCVKRVVKNLKK